MSVLTICYTFYSQSNYSDGLMNLNVEKLGSSDVQLCVLNRILIMWLIGGKITTHETYEGRILKLKFTNIHTGEGLGKNTAVYELRGLGLTRIKKPMVFF